MIGGNYRHFGYETYIWSREEGMLLQKIVGPQVSKLYLKRCRGEERRGKSH